MCNTEDVDATQTVGKRWSSGLSGEMAVAETTEVSSANPIAVVVQNSHSHRELGKAERSQAYTTSYRAMRLVVGVLGIILPATLIVGEAYFLRGAVQVRGSLSAYYHTPMRDIFVGALCVIGFMLITYMVGEREASFWVSLVAGIAVLGVTFFPKTRPGLADDAPRCGVDPSPIGCSSVQQALGESTTAVIHGVFAVIFILTLAVLSALFAFSELKISGRRTAGIKDRPKSRFKFAVHATLAALILLAGLYAFFGFSIWQLTRLYIGEVVGVLAFGASWIVAALPSTAPSREVPHPDS